MKPWRRPAQSRLPAWPRCLSAPTNSSISTEVYPPMPIAIASILQEANTFSPVMTRYEDFTPVFGQAVLDRHRGKMTEMGGFIETLTKARKQIAPVCAAWAITANRLLRADFE